jgi:hypothetical protein
MASPFQQQSFRRKMTYAGLIVVLLAVANFGVRGAEYLGKPAGWTMTAQANRLQLREQDKGDVELTDSAIRLSLTGSRGLAVCFLWIKAIEKQRKHEWNELELLVKSVAKLQPHFVTPWLFQSWNVAFNVSVECDDPRDKYFWISKGVQMLAEGERRNRGTSDPLAEVVFPGNPDMRFHLGFYYMLKIGKADENKTFRSLFQMSCMRPSDRNPDRLAPKDAEGRRQVNMKEFRTFCEKHPRFVRRLREQLKDFYTPLSIVTFLEENRDLPSRYEPNFDPQEVKLKKNARDRFPLLPPTYRGGGDLHDDDDGQGSSLEDDFDNFAAAREWYRFSQEPMPPMPADFGADGYHYDVRRYRLPRMTHYIFRQYHFLAQQTLAEELELEGWFDNNLKRSEKLLPRPVARKLAEEKWFDSKGWEIKTDGVKPVWFKKMATDRSGKPILKNKKPYSIDGKKVLYGGKPLPLDGEKLILAPDPVKVRGKTILYAGKPSWREVVVVVGTDDGHSAARAWDEAYAMFLQYGESSGLLMPEAREGELKKRYEALQNKSQKFKAWSRRHGGNLNSLPPEARTPELKSAYQAFSALQGMAHYRSISNFREHYYTADAERQPEALAARKLYFEALNLEKEGDLRRAVDRYRFWIEAWKDLLTKKPQYRENAMMLEDSYRQQLRYVRRFQTLHEAELKALFLILAQNSHWPFNHLKVDARGRWWNREDRARQWLTRDQKDRIIPTRNVWGPFDDVGEDGDFFDPLVVARVRREVLYPGKKAPPLTVPNLDERPGATRKPQPVPNP